MRLELYREASTNQCMFCEIVECPNRSTPKGCPSFVFDNGKAVMLRPAPSKKWGG